MKRFWNCYKKIIGKLLDYLGELLLIIFFGYSCLECFRICGSPSTWDDSLLYAASSGVFGTIVSYFVARFCLTLVCDIVLLYRLCKDKK